MKYIIATILTLILTISLWPQEQQSYPGEMFLGPINVTPPSQTLTFTIEVQSTSWAGSLDPRSYWISTEYDLTTFTPHENNELDPTHWRGWDFVTDPTSNPPYPIPIYAYGLYKMSTNHSNEYFYLDFRDDRYGYYNWYPPPTHGHDIDLWILYDAVTQKFSYCSDGCNDLNSFIEASNAELIPIWDMKQKGNPLTDLFPYYWAYCLAVTNDGNDHPRLVWGPYSEPLQWTIDNYKIYYSYHLTGHPPGTFYLLATVGANTFNYIDQTVEIGSDYRSKSYYVTAVYDDVEWDTQYETSPTNTVTVQLAIPHKIQIQENQMFFDAIDYTLSPNYPNPFNPTTTIAYSIQKDGLVTLKLFDILGKDVSTLVNEYKPAGSYKVEFKASRLPSGIYFYMLSSGSYTDTKKLILLK